MYIYIHIFVNGTIGVCVYLFIYLYIPFVALTNAHKSHRIITPGNFTLPNPHVSTFLKCSIQSVVYALGLVCLPGPLCVAKRAVDPFRDLH